MKSANQSGDHIGRSEAGFAVSDICVNNAVQPVGPREVVQFFTVRGIEDSGRSIGFSLMSNDVFDIEASAAVRESLLGQSGS